MVTVWGTGQFCAHEFGAHVRGVDVFSQSNVRFSVPKSALALAALPWIAVGAAQPAFAQTTAPASKADRRAEQQVPKDTKTSRRKIREAVRAKSEPRQRAENPRREATRTVPRRPSLLVIAPIDRESGSARYRYFLTLPDVEPGAEVRLSVDRDACAREQDQPDSGTVRTGNSTIQARVLSRRCLAYVAQLESS